MPTADKFTFILEAVVDANRRLMSEDISGLNYWTTLSGFNKNSTGSPSQSSINASLESAANLYFNTYSLAATVGGAAQTASVSGTTYEQPKSRVDWETNSISISNNGVYFQLNPIVRFYDGSTTNESNFVGYGLKSVASSTRSRFGVTDSIASGPIANVSLKCVSDETEVDDYVKRTISYVNFQGMHFVATLYASGFHNSSYRTVNVSTLSVTSTDLVEDGPDLTASVTLGNFTFFDY